MLQDNPLVIQVLVTKLLHRIYQAIYHLTQTLGIDAPILKSVYDILYNTANPIHEAEALLKRPIKESEFY